MTTIGPNPAVGSVYIFESNPKIREETGAYRAVAVHSFYQSDCLTSDTAFVWGETSAGFLGTITVLEEGRIRIDDEIRAYIENFNYENNTDNLILEAAREIGELLAGEGAGFQIVMVGGGRDVSGIYEYQIESRPGDFSGSNPRLVLTPLVPPECFPAGTPILLPSGDTIAIEDITPGTILASFDGDVELGRGALTSAPVTRVFRNVTQEMMVLSYTLSSGEQVKQPVTPGHHYINEHGTWETIERIAMRGGQLVAEDGALTSFAWTRHVYGEHTAYLFPEAEMVRAPTDAGGLFRLRHIRRRRPRVPGFRDQLPCRQRRRQYQPGVRVAELRWRTADPSG